MLGKEKGGIIKTNSFLRTSILNIINKEINEKPGSISLYFYQNEYFKDYALINRIFSLIHKGINGMNPRASSGLKIPQQSYGELHHILRVHRSGTRRRIKSLRLNFTLDKS